jgi:hypothetical protein
MITVGGDMLFAAGATGIEAFEDDRLIGVVEQLADSMGAEGLRLQVDVRARDCDRFESC